MRAQRSPITSGAAISAKLVHTASTYGPSRVISFRHLVVRAQRDDQGPPSKGGPPNPSSNSDRLGSKAGEPYQPPPQRSGLSNGPAEGSGTAGARPRPRSYSRDRGAAQPPPATPREARGAEGDQEGSSSSSSGPPPYRRYGNRHRSNTATRSDAVYDNGAPGGAPRDSGSSSRQPSSASRPGYGDGYRSNSGAGGQSSQYNNRGNSYSNSSSSSNSTGGQYRYSQGLRGAAPSGAESAGGSSSASQGPSGPRPIGAPPAPTGQRVQNSLARMIEAYKRGYVKIRGYVGQDLKEEDKREFSAAGVAFYDFTDRGDLVVLMLRQRSEDGYVPTSAASKQRLAWNFPGGKRDENDSCAEETAAREAQEETGGLLLSRNIQPFLRTVLFSQIGKYALFLHHLQGEEDLPERYQELLRVGVHCQGSGRRETVELVWVPLRTLKRIKTQPESNAYFHMFVGFLLLRTPLLRHLTYIENAYKLRMRARLAQELDGPSLDDDPAGEPEDPDSLQDLDEQVDRTLGLGLPSSDGFFDVDGVLEGIPEPPPRPRELDSSTFFSTLGKKRVGPGAAPSMAAPAPPAALQFFVPGTATAAAAQASAAADGSAVGPGLDELGEILDTGMDNAPLLGLTLRRRSFLRVGLAGYTVATHTKYACEVCGIEFARAQDTEAHLRSRYHRRRVQRLLFKELTRKLLEDGQVSTVLREPRNLHPHPNSQIIGGAASDVMAGPRAAVPFSEPSLRHLRAPWDPFNQRIRSHPKYVCEVCGIRFARAEDTVAHLKGSQHRNRVQRLLLEELLSLGEEEEDGEDGQGEDMGMGALLGAAAAAAGMLGPLDGSDDGLGPAAPPKKGSEKKGSAGLPEPVRSILKALPTVKNGKRAQAAAASVAAPAADSIPAAAPAAPTIAEPTAAAVAPADVPPGPSRRNRGMGSKGKQQQRFKPAPAAQPASPTPPDPAQPERQRVSSKEVARRAREIVSMSDPRHLAAVEDIRLKKAAAAAAAAAAASEAAAGSSVQSQTGSVGSLGSADQGDPSPAAASRGFGSGAVGGARGKTGGRRRRGVLAPGGSAKVAPSSQPAVAAEAGLPRAAVMELPGSSVEEGLQPSPAHEAEGPLSDSDSDSEFEAALEEDFMGIEGRRDRSGPGSGGQGSGGGGGRTGRRGRGRRKESGAGAASGAS